MTQTANPAGNNEGRRFEKMGLASLQEQKLDEAENHFQTALKHMQTEGDEIGQAYVLGNLGNLFFEQKRLDMAEESYEKSLKFMQKIKDKRGIESSHGNLGNVYLYRNNFEKAREHYQKALRIVEETKNIPAQVMYQENLGNVNLQLKDFPAAKQNFEKARLLLLAERQELEKVSILENKIKTIDNHPEYLELQAQDKQKEVDALIGSADKRTELLARYQELEELYFKAGRIEKVIEVSEKTAALLEEMEDPASLSICHANLASTLMQHGLAAREEQYLQRAEEEFNKALEGFESKKDQKRKSYILGTLGLLYHHRRKLDLALESFNKSLELMKELGDRLGEARSYANLGKIAADKGDRGQAEQFIHKSIELMERLENRPGMAQQYESWATFTFHKELEKAEEWFNVKHSRC